MVESDGKLAWPMHGVRKTACEEQTGCGRLHRWIGRWLCARGGPDLSTSSAFQQSCPRPRQNRLSSCSVSRALRNLALLFALHSAETEQVSTLQPSVGLGGVHGGGGSIFIVLLELK